MNPIDPEAFPVPDDPLDQSVRRNLDQEASKINLEAIWQNSLARLEAENQPKVQARRGWLKVASIMAIAAAMLIAFFLLPATQTVSASPSQILESARSMLSDETDRCYQTSLESGAIWPERIEKFFRESQPIYTRGNRFFQKITKDRGVWGRDSEGKIWIANAGDSAASFEAKELPRFIREFATIRGLELPALLEELLANFDLKWSTVSADRTILAERRGSAFALQIVRVEIGLSATSDTIQEMIVTRTLPGDQLVRIKFTQEACVPLLDELYSPAGHLEAKGIVYGSDRPLLRRRVMAQLFGEALLEGK